MPPFQSLPGTSFTVFGAPDSARLGVTTASAQMFFTPNWSFAGQVRRRVRLWLANRRRDGHDPPQVVI
jgi:hypothetical protein